jgi:hypothetical protein
MAMALPRTELLYQLAVIVVGLAKELILVMEVPLMSAYISVPSVANEMTFEIETHGTETDSPVLKRHWSILVLEAEYK